MKINLFLRNALDSFSLEEVTKLAQRYGINWEREKDDFRQLVNVLGGHPALVNIALYYLRRGEITLPQLIKTASDTTGIYKHHLQRHWANLAEQPDLLSALNSVIKSPKPVSLEPIVTYKLSSMGLIKQIENKAIPSCELYRQSFLQE